MCVFLLLYAETDIYQVCYYLQTVSTKELQKSLSPTIQILNNQIQLVYAVVREKKNYKIINTQNREYCNIYITK